jgi:CHAT domain-containing protein/Tfp pilus assembly protein PilF
LRSLRRVIAFFVPAWIFFRCWAVPAGCAPLDNTFQSSFEKGTTLQHAGEFWDAIRVFEHALGLAKSEKHFKHQLDCLLNLGILDWNIGDLKQSAAFYSEALSLSRKLGINSLAAECTKVLRIHELYMRGKAARMSRRFQQSIGQFEAAIGLGRAIGKSEFELKCLRQLSLNYFDLERMGQFLELNERALGIARQVKHRREEARCLNHIGVYYFKTSRYSKALALYDDALGILKGTDRNETDETDCLNNIALIYLSLGDYDKALKNLEEALVIDSRLNSKPNVCIGLNNIGEILRNRACSTNVHSQFARALEYFCRALDLSRKTNNKQIEIYSLNNLGLSYSSLGDYATALGHFQTALREATALGRTGDIGTILCNIGHSNLQMGDFFKAKGAFSRALDMALKTSRDDVLWETYFGLGKCLENEGELASALICYKKAADIIDMIRRRLSWDDQKTGFARDKWKVYEAWVDILFQIKQTGYRAGSDLEIWGAIEKAKARAFFEELSQVENPRRQPLDPRDLQVQKSLTRKISLTISKLAERDLPGEKRKDLLDSLEREEADYANLINRLRTDVAADSMISADDDISLDRVQHSLLDPETAILEFFLGEKRSFVVLITQGQLVVNPLPSRSTIEDSLKAYLKILSSPPRGNFSGFGAGRRIYRDFISPLEAHLGPPIRNLIIVPDGILCYLPFETLVRDGREEAGGRYLIETYQVSYAPSVASLALLAHSKPEKNLPRRILALGSPIYSRRSSSATAHQKTYAEVLREIYLDNGFDFSELPYSRKEVLQIAKVFPPESVDTYIGIEAKEEVIKRSSLTDYQIIHFACHGFLDENAPLRSALVLSLDDDLGEDGFLQAREIYELRLNADLVVLSACQTGKGRLENGEGVLGLPRAFLCAGARSTISSLWKIGDRSTSSLMNSLYHFLADGLDKAQALRKAKLRMLRSRLSHPFYWAGFVLNGDYRSRLTGVPVSR